MTGDEKRSIEQLFDALKKSAETTDKFADVAKKQASDARKILRKVR